MPKRSRNGVVRSPARVVAPISVNFGSSILTERAADDLRERGLAEARRADEEHVVERVLARFRRFDEPLQVRPRLALADELGQHLRPERRFGVVLAALGGEETVGGGHRLARHARPWAGHPRLRRESRGWAGPAPP